MNPTTFYYTDGISQFGPFNKEELRSKNITPQTLVWFEGLDNWTPAGQLPEMRDLFETVPPPIPTANVSHEHTVMPAAGTQRQVKDFSQLLFIFSIIGIVLSSLMVFFSTIMAIARDRVSYYDYFSEMYHSYKGIDSEWGFFFFIISAFLLVFSILTLVKMKKTLRARRQAHAKKI